MNISLDEMSEFLEAQGLMDMIDDTDFINITLDEQPEGFVLEMKAVNGFEITIRKSKQQ